MSKKQRTGVLVKPYQRLSDEEIRIVDQTSRMLLEDPGLLCYNPGVTKLFREAGAVIEEEPEYSRIRVASELLDRIIALVPDTVVLGARDPDNRMILDAKEPRVRFASGSETNIWLSVADRGGKRVFERQNGSLALLAEAAHLCNHLEHCDSFIRCVNIQDEYLTAENKDVNKFAVCLNNSTKHIMGGIDSLEALDAVQRVGELVAGGAQAFRENPVISLITCVIKSPLQIVEDTAWKTMEIARRGIPVVISSSPMGGTTAPFDEFGMVAQINAEILAGIAITQLASPGAPVLYGSVPVRTRIDNLYDMYGAPEFVQYNVDCAQMARYYGIPNYSSAGVADATEPGIQATFEKMLTHALVPQSGAQYVHYAFGLLDRTSCFCPEQAVLDNAHIGAIKWALEKNTISTERREAVVQNIRDVMATSQKLYVYDIPIPPAQPAYVAYPLESERGDALDAAHDEYTEISSRPHSSLPEETRAALLEHVGGIVPQALNNEGEQS